MAIAFHALSLVTGRTWDQTRALNLYQQVFQSLQRVGNGNLEATAIVMLASCNNTGHLNSLRLDRIETGLSVQLLGAILDTIHQEGIRPVDLDFFVMARIMGVNAHNSLQMAASA